MGRQRLVDKLDTLGFTSSVSWVKLLKSPGFAKFSLVMNFQDKGRVVRFTWPSAELGCSLG